MRTSAGTGARVEFPSVLFLSCAAYRKTEVIANPPPVLGFRGTAIALVQRVIAANFRSIAVWHSKQTFYLPELDALRFFAFLAVFLCHVAVRDGRFTWEARTGMLGVDLFFALSAFLISELLLREKDRNGTLDVRAFWISRIVRIWPLYFTMLAVAFILRAPLRESLLTLAGFALFAGNFPALFATPSPLIGAVWSLSIEEQFYLTWPLVARRLNRSGIIKAAAAVWSFSVVARAVIAIVAARHGGRVALYLAQATVFRFDAIAVGLALSASGIRCDARMRPFIAIVSVAVIVLAGGWLYGLGRGLSQTFGFSLAAVGCGGLLLASIGARWMRNGWMGAISVIFPIAFTCFICRSS
jgi:peptidoglycan/LPS O-acetylase OafA/YrhL